MYQININDMKTETIKLFSNTEKLTLNALVNIGVEKGLKPYELKLCYSVVYDVLKQLEEIPKLKNNNIKLK